MCVFAASGTERAMRMRHIILSSVGWPVLPYFFTIPHKRYKFKKNFFEKVCFDFLYKFGWKRFSFQEKFSEILSQMYIEFHVKCLSLLYGFNESWIFSTDFQNLNTLISIFMKIRPLGADMFRAGTQTGMTKLRVAFRKFAKANKNLLPQPGIEMRIVQPKTYALSWLLIYWNA